MLLLITAHHQSEEENPLVIQPTCFLFHVPILTKLKKNKTKNSIPLLGHLYMLLLFCRPCISKVSINVLNGIIPHLNLTA